MIRLVLAMSLLAGPVLAQEAPAPICTDYGSFTREMAAKGAVIAMAEMVQDGTDRRLEAYYQADTCVWTLAIVQRSKGKITASSLTCLLGEGDPGVCIPKK
jgi:hypothetical protein